MSKDRPIKSFRIEGERPFKSYNPSIPSSSVLFADPRRQEEPLTLPTSVSSLMQQQQQQQQERQRQQQQQQQQQQRPGVPGQLNAAQQVYGDPGDYLRLNPQQQAIPSNMLVGLEPSPLNPYAYDDLDLPDPDNPLLRADLMVTSESLIHQREQDLNISISATSQSAVANFMMPNRNIFRTAGTGGLGSPDPITMLLDQQMAPFPTGLSRSMGATSTISSSALSGGHYSQSSSSQFLVDDSHPSNGNNRAGMVGTTSSLNLNHFPVKQEADEGGSMAESPSPSSLNSPTQSDPSADGFGDSSQKRSMKRSVSESSASSAISPPDKPSTSRLDQNGSGGKGKQETSKDPAYLEKRRKNNESAKRSREARRTKEELVAFRVISLEEENMKLRAEIRLLDKELDELRNRLYQCN